MLVRQPTSTLAGRRAFTALATCAAYLTGALPALATPVTVPTSVADALMGQGSGLCGATAKSSTPNLDFGNFTSGTYNGGLNAFMEAHKVDRVESTLQSILDLSNNNLADALLTSYGDFTDAMTPQCKKGGCDFLYNDTTTAFGARYRGFFNVTADLAGKPMHIGFFADDAVSLTFFDKIGNAYPLLTQPPQLGFPTWRLTETVTFKQAGLYPLEILYVEIGDNAAMEMSYFLGDFMDFQRSAQQVPVVNLKTAGFTLFKQDAFFQTLSGAPAFPTPAACQQCDRQFVNHAGNNGCGGGYYCNDAALCAPCDTAIFCGPTCSPCGGSTPFCINGNAKVECGACRTDLDCATGFSCDPSTHVCNQCNVDGDCDRGKTCVAHACQWCATPDKCAGNSCNCCPNGQNGKQMACAPIDQGAPPECVECKADADCATGVCDRLTGQCMKPPLATNESTACCGDGCLHCPMDAPICLPGPFGTACAQCRSDLDCHDSEQFCLGGVCTDCTRDRRCGSHCKACGGDKPFCLATQRPVDAKCVRCNIDAECVGGACDKTTHACVPACVMSCAPATPYCDGKSCVECYADTQCPCGGSCDLSTHTCSSSCKSNADCVGDGHCHFSNDGSSKSCSPGALPDNANCGGTLADLCTGNTIGSRGADPTPAGGVAALTLMALVLRRLRLRSRRGAR